MIWVWIALALWTVALIVRGLRRRPPATYAPMPPVVDTARHGFDEGRLSGPPYDFDDELESYDK